MSDRFTRGFSSFIFENSRSPRCDSRQHLLAMISYYGNHNKAEATTPNTNSPPVVAP